MSWMARYVCAAYIGLQRITDVWTMQFKLRLTTTMVIDFAGCWVIEVVCKHLFADLQPKAMITAGRDRREKRRQAVPNGKTA